MLVSLDEEESGVVDDTPVIGSQTASKLHMKIKKCWN